MKKFFVLLSTTLFLVACSQENKNPAGVVQKINYIEAADPIFDYLELNCSGGLVYDCLPEVDVQIGDTIKETSDGKLFVAQQKTSLTNVTVAGVIGKDNKRIVFFDNGLMIGCSDSSWVCLNEVKKGDVLEVELHRGGLVKVIGYAK